MTIPLFVEGFIKNRDNRCESSRHHKMNHIEKSIRERRSVRTFDQRELTDEDRTQLSDFMKNIDLPFDMSIEFKYSVGILQFRNWL